MVVQFRWSILQAQKLIAWNFRIEYGSLSVCWSWVAIPTSLPESRVSSNQTFDRFQTERCSGMPAVTCQLSIGAGGHSAASQKAAVIGSDRARQAVKAAASTRNREPLRSLTNFIPKAKSVGLSDRRIKPASPRGTTAKGSVARGSVRHSPRLKEHTSLEGSPLRSVKVSKPDHWKEAPDESLPDESSPGTPAAPLVSSRKSPSHGQTASLPGASGARLTRSAAKKAAAAAEEAAEEVADEDALLSLSHTTLPTSVPHLSPTKDGVSLEAALECETAPVAAVVSAAAQQDESAIGVDTPNTRSQGTSVGPTKRARSAELTPAGMEPEPAPIASGSPQVQAAQQSLVTPPAGKETGGPTPRRSSKRQRAAVTEADATPAGSAMSPKTRGATSSEAATSPAPGPLTTAVLAVAAAAAVVHAVAAPHVYAHSGLHTLYALSLCMLSLYACCACCAVHAVHALILRMFCCACSHSLHAVHAVPLLYWAIGFFSWRVARLLFGNAQEDNIKFFLCPACS